MLLQDRLIIKPYTSLLSPIIYDRSRVDMYKQGEVLQIGTDIESIEVGDKVMFGTHAGIDFEGNKMIRESDCIAKLDQWI